MSEGTCKLVKSVIFSINFGDSFSAKSSKLWKLFGMSESSLIVRNLFSDQKFEEEQLDMFNQIEDKKESRKHGVKKIKEVLANLEGN